MIKQTITISNPYHLAVELDQLLLKSKETGEVFSRPIEDIGLLILDHPQVSVTTTLLHKLTAANVVVIYCDDKHLPAGIFFPFDGHHTQSQHYRYQLQVSASRQKQLWQQTIKAKIRNQAAVLDNTGADATALKTMAKKVRSGDPDNLEGKAAKWYWPRLFGSHFTRERYGSPPNPSLNYGYTIVRAAMARAIAGAGLMPALGIHHHNKYNAFCLADDLMEPYRPFVDWVVWQMRENDPQYHVLDKNRKAQLLSILQMDTLVNKRKTPLQIAIQRTASSLVNIYKGEQQTLSLPQFTP